LLPVFWGESELYAFAFFCQGLFQNSLFVLLRSRFVLSMTAKRNYMQFAVRVKDFWSPISARNGVYLVLSPTARQCGYAAKLQFHREFRSAGKAFARMQKRCAAGGEGI